MTWPRYEISASTGVTRSVWSSSSTTSYPSYRPCPTSRSPCSAVTGRARQRRARARELLAAVDLGDRAHRLPTELSGGERQRVAIARALANEPKILLADEPTGSLDSASTERFLNLLRHLGDTGMTVVLVTHDSEVAEHADRIIEMRDGAIVS